MSKPGQDWGLDDWLQWLEELHPATIELGLERVSAVFERLALDFSGRQIVTVGGTNGKGSSVAMLDNILRAAGYSTGCYTSPHLLRYNERVSVNGRPVTDAELCAAFATVEAVRGNVSLTYFEYGTLAALVLFAASKPDFLILEVGLGGRLDAVNIMDADISIVTNVALDHMDWLGDDRESIGREKAGIYRAGKPAIYGESDMPQSVRRVVNELGAMLLHNTEQYSWQAGPQSWRWQGRDRQGNPAGFEDLPPTGFPGDNAAAVLQALQFLDADVDIGHIRQGLQGLTVAGRFQELVFQGCRVILDVAHNPHAAAHLGGRMQALARHARVHLVIAMLGDKDSSAVARLLVPHAPQVYVAPLPGERGAPAEIIYNHALEAGAETVKIFGSVPEAFAAAVAAVQADCKPAAASSGEQEIIVVTGSFYTVAAVLELVSCVA